MTQFKMYCKKHAGAIFTYDSRNDKIKVGASPCYADNPYKSSHIGYYDKVIIMLNPNRICFRNNHTATTFDNVEQILVDDEYLQDVSDVITIICKGDSTHYIILTDRII